MPPTFWKNSGLPQEWAKSTNIEYSARNQHKGDLFAFCITFASQHVLLSKPPVRKNESRDYLPFISKGILKEGIINESGFLTVQLTWVQ